MGIYLFSTAVGQGLFDLHGSKGLLAFFLYQKPLEISKKEQISFEEFRRTTNFVKVMGVAQKLNPWSTI